MLACDPGIIAIMNKVGKKILLGKCWSPLAAIISHVFLIFCLASVAGGHHDRTGTCRICRHQSQMHFGL